MFSLAAAGLLHMVLTARQSWWHNGAILAAPLFLLDGVLSRLTFARQPSPKTR
jgi:hypothetical protein